MPALPRSDMHTTHLDKASLLVAGWLRRHVRLLSQSRILPHGHRQQLYAAATQSYTLSQLSVHTGQLSLDTQNEGKISLTTIYLTLYMKKKQMGKNILIETETFPNFIYVFQTFFLPNLNHPIQNQAISSAAHHQFLMEVISFSSRLPCLEL